MRLAFFADHGPFRSFSQVLLSISAILALVHLVLKALTIQQPFTNIHLLPAILHLASLPMLMLLAIQNHHHSLRSSSIILLFWPIYVVAIAVYMRTRIAMISLGQNHSAGWGSWDSPLAKASLAMFLASVSFGALAWVVECWGPEEGGIVLGDEVDYKTKGKTNGNAAHGDEAVFDAGSDAGAGGESMEEKVLMEDNESPFLRANIYSRLWFMWLTRESRALPAFIP